MVPIKLSLISCYYKISDKASAPYIFGISVFPPRTNQSDHTITSHYMVNNCSKVASLGAYGASL